MQEVNLTHEQAREMLEMPEMREWFKRLVSFQGGLQSILGTKTINRFFQQCNANCFIVIDQERPPTMPSPAQWEIFKKWLADAMKRGGLAGPVDTGDGQFKCLEVDL